MKLKEAYMQGKQKLKKANIIDYDFDNMCIFEHCFRMNKQELILNEIEQADLIIYKNYLELIEQRANKRPLQYILGTWEFMGLPFKVGEGVLIPREDTETLVNEVLNKIKSIKYPVVFDLCGGSGAIAISVAKKRLDAKIFCVEISDKAYYYLNENIKHNKINNITAIKGDILNFNSVLEKIDKKLKADVIVSNPPYIKSAELADLQPEVKKEPKIALDGGNDGLLFYRAILKNWLKILKYGGILAVEIGINQKSDVCRLFLNNGLSNIKVLKDLNGIERVVSACCKLN